MPPTKPSPPVGLPTAVKSAKGAVVGASTRTVQGSAIVTHRDVGSVVVVPLGRRLVSLTVARRMVGQAFATIAATRVRAHGAGLFPLMKKIMTARRAQAKGVKVARVKPLRPRAEAEVRRTATPAVTTAQMLEAGLLAFQEIATRWQLTNGEQSGLLQVSESSLLRWKKAPPSRDEVLLDRLQLVLVAFQRVNELAGSEMEAAALVRRAGSALNDEDPSQTVLQMLSVPSILEMNRHVQRLDAQVHAW